MAALRHSLEFKLAAVKLVSERGYSIAEAEESVDALKAELRRLRKESWR